MQPIVLRTAQTSDIPAIAMINEAGRPNVSPINTQSISEVRMTAPYFIVAETDHAVVGYIIGYTADNVYDGEEFAWFKGKFAQFLYIDQIAIAPSARAQGIGARFYTHAANFCQERQFPMMVCEVNLDPPNPISLKFHTHIGFRELEVLKVSDGRTVSLLQKNLS
jgi:uncharacterized protein